MPRKLDSMEAKGERILSTIERSLLEHQVVEGIRTVYDPEIPVNVYDLGLIYGIEVDEQARVLVSMTLTSPACPVAGTLPLEVENAVRDVSGVSEARVELVWDPPFTIDRIPEHIRLELGMFW